MADKGPELYTPAQVNALIGDLTAGEVWRISEAGPRERTKLTLLALHAAAQRSGLINGMALEDFLDRVRLADLGGIVEGKVAAPLSADGGTDGEPSPISADTGD